jgi:hypothetical protein
MLIPNNLNIFGRITGAATLHGYRLRAEFPENTAIAYLKRPLSNTVENQKRVLTYALEDLINYDDYWWLPLDGETEFLLPLNLLPPFPELNPVDLKISCTPDIVVGVEADVTTTVNIQAEEHVDNMFLTLSAPPFASPGVSMTITDYSEDNVKEPRQSVTSPRKEFPFPKLSLRPGEAKEYRVKTRIAADLPSMTSLKCQHDILRTRLIVLSESTPQEPPCSITILDNRGSAIPVKTTEKSTVLQAQAQIMYTPFSIRQSEPSQTRKKVIEAPAI